MCTEISTANEVFKNYLCSAFFFKARYADRVMELSRHFLTVSSMRIPMTEVSGLICLLSFTL